MEHLSPCLWKIQPWAIWWVRSVYCWEGVCWSSACTAWASSLSENSIIIVLWKLERYLVPCSSLATPFVCRREKDIILVFPSLVERSHAAEMETFSRRFQEGGWQQLMNTWHSSRTEEVTKVTISFPPGWGQQLQCSRTGSPSLALDSSGLKGTEKILTQPHTSCWENDSA